MTKTHTHQDVYIDDKLKWKSAIVEEDVASGRLVVKARLPEHPSAWTTVAVLTDVSLTKERGRSRYYSGLDPDGESVALAAVTRTDTGCIPCGARR